MNLKNEHNGMYNDVQNSQNRIKDLKTRKEILNSQIADLLKDKRIVDKLHMELSDVVQGKPQSDFQEQAKKKEAERTMRIQKDFLFISFLECGHISRPEEKKKR